MGAYVLSNLLKESSGEDKILVLLGYKSLNIR